MPLAYRGGHSSPTPALMGAAIVAVLIVILALARVIAS